MIKTTTRVQPQTISVGFVTTPLGTMSIEATDEGVSLLEFSDEDILTPPTTLDFHPYISMVQTQLDEYFARKRKTFTLPLVVSGTPFQQQVWQALLSIPYGETRSYLQQSHLIGSSLAIRAVANANSRNKITLLIPCHRVIGTNGSLTGYSAGLERKKYLLDLESRSV